MDPYGEIAPLVEPDALTSWFVHEDANLIVVNKPGWLVCHPSKRGPYSSLVGAMREHLKSDKLHLVARLDRETSGLVLFAKDASSARRYQMAIQRRIVSKTYLAVLEGEFTESICVNQPILQAAGEIVHIKAKACEHPDAQAAETHFHPMVTQGGYTFCRIEPITGRKHQIRAHAEWLGHPVTGDKIYGADPTLFLEFIEYGWTPRQASALPIQRHALHCYRYAFDFIDGLETYTAPLQEDMLRLCAEKMQLSALGSMD